MALINHTISADIVLPAISNALIVFILIKILTIPRSRKIFLSFFSSENVRILDE